jgi:DNA mismatch repair ATPase MutS
MKHACSSGTLFQILNKTRTACGGRLLKASLLQPLIDAGTIMARLDAVEELSGCVEPCTTDNTDANAGDAEQVHAMSFGLALWLKNNLPRDLDQTCRGLGLMSGSTAKNSTSLAQQLTKLVHAVLSLKKLLSVLPSLAEILQPATATLLTAVRANIQTPIFADLLAAIHECVDEDADALKNPFMSQIQCVFAVKVSRIYPFLF